MPSTPKRVLPYNFDPLFEKQVVLLACSRSKFFGRVGVSMDPELFKSAPAQLAMRAAHAIARDLGHGPESSLLVVQRLRRWMEEGRQTLEEIKAVAEMFDEAEDAREGSISVEAAIAEIAPMLQRRMRDLAVEAAVGSYANPNDDLSLVLDLANKANRIGQVDTSVGTILGNDSFDAISKIRSLTRLPTGITELDSGLDGGLQGGGLGVVLGGSGDGKSMFLGQAAGTTWVGGGFVGYATLEVPSSIILARIKAGITSVPINNIIAGDDAKARKRLAHFSAFAGRLVVQDFTPLVTTIEDLFEWVARCEDQAKREMDTVIVDYGDKVGTKTKNAKGEVSEYNRGQIVFEGLRTYANERKKYVWTASASTRRKDRKRLLDLDDTADSMHKIRVADLVITMNIEDLGEGEAQMLRMLVAKHRTGRSRFTVGPIPVEYDMGRVCSFAGALPQ